MNPSSVFLLAWQRPSGTSSVHVPLHLLGGDPHCDVFHWKAPAPCCHTCFDLQHHQQPPRVKRRVIDWPQRRLSMFKNVHKMWLLISFGPNPLSQTSASNLGWGITGGIVLLCFHYRRDKELIQPAQLKLKHCWNTQFLEPVEWFSPRLVLFDLRLLCACQHKKPVRTQTNVRQKFHSCSILDIDSCLLFCLMQTMHPIAKSIFQFLPRTDWSTAAGFAASFHLAWRGLKCRGKICCASGISLNQIYSQRDNLSEKWALKRMLKIVLKFWNTGQWHWKSEKMSSPNSHFIKALHIL